MGNMTRYFIVLALVVSFAAALSSTALSDKGHGHTEKKTEDTDVFFKGASKQNGFSIYFDGMTLKGERIEIEGGPHWLYMHGGGCASCHGDKGQGGFLPMMCNSKTPPITLMALMSGEHVHDGTEDKHTPYTIEKIKRALEFSINPALKPFDPCMPKWLLKEDDFRDLLYYMKSLDK